MGSKTPSATAAPPEPPAQDTQMLEMMNMMMGMMGSMQQAPIPPQIPQTPTIYRGPEIDWTEKNQQLAAKARADFKSDSAKKKGRKSTILTSPLLDEESPDTTESLLAPVPNP